MNVIPSGGFDYKLDTQGISLLDHIASQHKAEFVIIDTLQEVKPQSKKGGTAYDIDGEVLGNIQKWATQKRIAVLMVTHLRKAIDPDNPFNDIQGSVGVQAKADCLILLREFEGVYTLFVKGRDFESKDYTLEFKDGLWHTQNDAVGYSQTTAQREILECLASAPEGLKAREIADTIGKDYNTVKPVLTRLKFRTLSANPHMAYGHSKNLTISTSNVRMLCKRRLYTMDDYKQTMLELIIKQNELIITLIEKVETLTEKVVELDDSVCNLKD